MKIQPALKIFGGVLLVHVGFGVLLSVAAVLSVR